MYKSYTILRSFKPDVVIGTGGFASGAVLKVAAMLNIPTVIQEQNSFPGITNKLLAKKANVICVAYENLERFFPKNKIRFTGNPVRQDLIDVSNKKNEAISHFNLDVNKKTLLILGGSLGARRLNQLVEKDLDFFTELGFQIIWQCGKHYLIDYAKNNERENVQVTAFIDRMDLVYAAADIVISRSGASSVSELCIVGKPTIFIPSPNVSEDHQTKNAKAIVDKGGAVMIKESDLESEFNLVFEALVKDKGKLESLTENIKKLALPNATKDIVEEIKKLI
jgi:UDP-N-acetylglucosamine--N-acetylmuramyl-(pentapeptide) pyrophosphoryl-undecaprenol N-acetylglucosamine transferase